MSASTSDRGNRSSRTTFFSVPSLRSIFNHGAKLQRGSTAPEMSSTFNQQHTDSSTLCDSTTPTKSTGTTTAATSSRNHHNQTIANSPYIQVASTNPTPKSTPTLETNQKYIQACQAIFEAPAAIFELTKQRKLMAEERAASREVMAELDRRERLESKMNGWWRRIEEEGSEGVNEEGREKEGEEESGVGDEYDAGSWCESNVGLNYDDSSSDEDEDLLFGSNHSRIRSGRRH